MPHKTTSKSSIHQDQQYQQKRASDKKTFSVKDVIQKEMLMRMKSQYMRIQSNETKEMNSFFSKMSTLTPVNN